MVPPRSAGMLLTALLISFSGMVQAKKVVILGIDGMDPNLLIRFAAEGAMPHFARLMEQGDFSPLQTTAVPQSPVAWSTFITGMDPGGHGIYDFVHRDPQTLIPFLSIARVLPARRSIGLGSWSLPLGSGRVELLRRGRAFWELLGERGIPTVLFRMPANFPPVEATHSKQIAGMGTPDILGTPGTYSLYTEYLPARAEEFSGGQVFQVEVVDDCIQAQLRGPENPYRRIRRSDGEYGYPESTADFEVFIDRDAGAARFAVGEEKFILEEGEWSAWVRIDFELVPWLVSTSALARFYLKQFDPHFELYVTPLQINPEDPAMRISAPSDWAGQLCSCLGYFYTQGMPEDTKAFTHGVFTGREFFDQVLLTYEETHRIHTFLQEDFADGLFFFYYGTLDQGCHMLWHYMDEAHPLFVDDPFLADGIRRLYQEMDAMLGEVLTGVDGETTLIVMSDHGFAPFYWGVNLNTWLLEKGYIALRNPEAQEETQLFDQVDWRRTRAYAMGLNSVYVNLKGREREGTVEPGSTYERLLDELEAELLEMRDPHTGLHPVSRVTRPRREFHGPHRDGGADLLVGYGRGYRSSWESPLGAFPRKVFAVNDQPWSGDHCIDHRLVPGVLVTNQEIFIEGPALHDLTVTILDEWGIEPLPGMVGRDCLRPLAHPRTAELHGK